MLVIVRFEIDWKLELIWWYSSSKIKYYAFVQSWQSNNFSVKSLHLYLLYCNFFVVFIQFEFFMLILFVSVLVTWYYFYYTLINFISISYYMELRETCVFSVGIRPCSNSQFSLFFCYVQSCQTMKILQS